MSDTSRRTFFLTGLALPAAARTRAPEPAVPLRYRTLGKTGLRVTELGCGCEAVSDYTVLQHAADLGINFFDTARAYEGGNNERVLKAALGGRRKSVVIASRSYAKDARTVKDHLDTSLKEIGTDYLDIWYFGDKSAPEDLNDEMLAVQLAAQKAGKIRFRGVSTHRLHRMVPFIVKNRFDVVQIPYNFAIGTRRDQNRMDATDLESSIGELKRAGIGVVAMKVMAGRWHGRAEDNPLYSVYRQTNGRAAAIRWALRDERVQTTSVRMVDRDQVNENIRAMAGPFSADDGKILSATLETIKPLYCRECGACDGACPKGLPVSDIVRSVMYAEGYGHFEMGYSRFQRLPADLKSVRCSECAACAVECPNGVRIQQRLARAQHLFA
jgi:predicted aldo/keto reductase-like oxidoreductase